MKEASGAITRISRSALEIGALRAYVDDYEIRGDYSGRAMYGASCLGLVVDKPAAAFAILAGIALEEAEFGDVAGNTTEALLAAITSARVDDTGILTIVYLPGVALDDDLPPVVTREPPMTPTTKDRRLPLSLFRRVVGERKAVGKERQP